MVNSIENMVVRVMEARVEGSRGLCGTEVLCSRGLIVGMVRGYHKLGGWQESLMS